MLFSIYVSASSADIGTPNIEQGDGIWGTINVDTPGLVSVNAWSTSPTTCCDDILLNLYNQTGKVVDSNTGRNGQTSIDYTAPTTGTYAVKVILTSAWSGGTRTISISSNKQISSMQKNIRRASNVAQGQAIFYNIRLNQGDLVFLNEWSTSPTTCCDGVLLNLYNQSGKPMVSNTGRNGQTSMDYAVPTTGIYTVKAVLTSAWGDGKRTISVSSNFPLENSTPVPVPTTRFSIIDIKKSSETAPEIKIETITKQNLTNATTLLSGSAWSKSGIKSVTVNGKYAGNEHWSVNVPGNNNIVIIAVGNDGNITTENISLRTDTPVDTIKSISIILALIGVICSIILVIFGPGNPGRRDKIYKTFILIKNKFKK